MELFVPMEYFRVLDITDVTSNQGAIYIVPQPLRDKKRYSHNKLELIHLLVNFRFHADL